MATTGVYIDITGFAVIADAAGVKQVVFEVSIRLNAYAWTVFRSHASLEQLRHALGASAPPVPPGRVVDSKEAFELSRQEILHWIHGIVSDNVLCSKPEFHEFLRSAANEQPAGVVAKYSRESTAASSVESAPSPSPSTVSSSASTASASTLAAAGAGAGPQKAKVTDFKLLKVLGRGSFGKVMLVRKLDTGNVYAMKVLQKEHIRKRKQVANTQTERDILANVRHPFVVGLKYAFQTADKLYFVLEYCPGGELFFHLGKEGRFYEGRAKFYTAEILLALEHLHSVGVVYRDLKPENVMLDANGNVKITDFGLSKSGVVDSAAGATSFCGTPEYLPPEVVRRTEYGTAADWWSLGALLHEMLTGWPPFFSQDRAELFRRIANETLTLPGGLSPLAADLLTRLLHKDPRQRLGSVGGGADVRAHPFFAGVDWQALYDGRIPAPWKPTITSVEDVSWFDSEFTKRAAEFSPPTAGLHAARMAPVAADGTPSSSAAPSTSSATAASHAAASSLAARSDHFAGFSYVNPAGSMLSSGMHAQARAVAAAQTPAHVAPSHTTPGYHHGAGAGSGAGATGSASSSSSTGAVGSSSSAAGPMLHAPVATMA